MNLVIFRYTGLDVRFSYNVGRRIMQVKNLKAFNIELRSAIQDYRYDFVTCEDFSTFRAKRHTNLAGVETLIRQQLFSEKREDVKDGLSNVVFWGFASQGVQRYRVNVFREDVSGSQLDKFIKLLNDKASVGLWDIKQLRLPQFGQVSFASKLLTFLYPERCAILDLQISKFAKGHNLPLDDDGSPLFDNLKFSYYRGNPNAIPITKSRNVPVYEEWILWCKRVAETVNEDAPSSSAVLRPVDVERGIFWRIVNGRDSLARFLLKGPQ